MIYDIESEANQLSALDYMADWLKGFLFFEHLGRRTFVEECLNIKIVAAPGMPQDQDFRYGWRGSRSVAEEWLIADIIAHLQAYEANLAIIEDPCCSPSDPRLTEGAAGPAWFYKERVLWPITQAMASTDLITKAMLWGISGMPEIFGFCRLFASVSNISEDIVIDEDVLIELGSSIKRLVTDIFDGEGYLVWTRKGWEDLDERI